MNAIFRFFVVNWKFSILTTVFTLLIGLLSLGLLQRESFPPVNFAVVSVQTIYPGASPEEVHDKVTKQIEDQLRGLEGIKDVRSISQSESSEITVRIDIDGVDSEQVVADIQRAVQRASAKLPPEVIEAPRVLEINAKEIPVLEVALVGPNENRQRDKLADRLKEIIEDVSGVSNVRLVGYLDRELQVLLDQQKLIKYGVALSEVYSSLSQQVKNIPSGYLDDKSSIGLVRVIGKSLSPEKIEKTGVRSNDSGVQITIKDIGNVVEGGVRPRVLTRVNGQEATLVVTTKKADVDALGTLNEVQVRIDDFTKQLPANYQLIRYNDEGARITNRLDIVSFNALSGMLVVLLVLFLFLPGKVGLMSSLSLPICALGSVAFMILAGANFNIITMIALIICLGNLVDNSVVISENYTSLREAGVPAQDAAIQSAQQFWVPFTASTITIIAAFIPMLVTQGVMGQFIRWIPIIVSIALVLSLLESLILLPARLQFINPKPKSIDSPKSWFSKFEMFFALVIGKVVKRKYLTLVAMLALLFSGCAVTAVFNRFELFPAEGIEYYIGRFTAPAQTSIYQTDRIGAQIAEEVKNVISPEALASIVVRSGIQQTDPADPRAKVGENVGLALIAIKPKIAPSLDIKETLAKLNQIKKPSSLEKLNFEPIESGPPVGKPLTLTLRSSDYDQLSAIRTELLKALEPIPGIIGLEDDELNMGVEYQFVPKDVALSYTGISVERIGLNLRTALAGSVAAKLSEDGKDFDLVVRFSDTSRNQISDLTSLEIPSPRGPLVPLLGLGEFKKVASPMAQRNFDYRRAITISAEVDNIKLTSAQVNTVAREKFKGLSAKYPSVTAKFGGEEESTNESLRSLAIALVLAVFGIFATLVFTFSSFSLPILVLSTIPLGLVGVLFSFTIIHRPLSFLAFIGIVGLTGVVINSAIILVDYIRELRELEPTRPVGEILVLASTRRLRAVLATGLTTVVGLLPTAFGWGGYDAALVDITLALSWGMIVGTLLTLLWIPAGYLILEAIKTKFSSFRSLASGKS